MSEERGDPPVKADDAAAAKGALDEWTLVLAEALDVEAAFDRNLILDLARDSAHRIARPAAPLTTFLVGIAAGRAGGDGKAIREAARIALALLAAR
jgi:hypothetical protein